VRRSSFLPNLTEVALCQQMRMILVLLHAQRGTNKYPLLVGAFRQIPDAKAGI
jgi:hypothetical protein